MRCTGRLVAVLLLAAALLGFAARAASHEHLAAPAAGDGLCAICVYGGSSLGGAPAAHAQACLPFQPPRPCAGGCAALPDASPLVARIRGPPVPA